MVDHVVEFDQYTEPMKRLLEDFATERERRSYVVSSAHPRLVNGKPSQEPALSAEAAGPGESPRETYLAEIARAAGARDSRRTGRSISR